MFDLKLLERKKRQVTLTPKVAFLFLKLRGYNCLETTFEFFLKKDPLLEEAPKMTFSGGVS